MKSRPSISYAITVCNEFEEIQLLLNQLIENKAVQDEIVVLLDVNNQDDRVVAYLQKLRIGKFIELHGGHFEKDFAAWKNQLNLYCTKDYIFNIDADEMLSSDCFTLLPLILQENAQVDLFYIARNNQVAGITQQHLLRWNWNQDGEGRINFPDAQGRIYKNQPTTKWIGQVHETITGAPLRGMLPEQLYLLHNKTIEKQVKQNDLYSSL